MEIILTSIVAFTSTNIDDIFILTLFFGDKHYKSSHIWFGQYVGIITLVAVSITGSFIGNFIDTRYVGLLGFFPIYLGVRQLLRLFRKQNADEESETRNSKTGIVHVAAVTFAHGGDNIGTYIPLFTTLTYTDRAIMVVIFLVMTSLWLATAKYLATHPLLARVIAKYGQRITPIALCLLGLFILKQSGTYDLFNDR